jgi:glycosyltransferase involved in cell wall biosynthesis
VPWCSQYQWVEPFGLVIAEALACGTPVITRPLGAAPEIVRNGETGFLCDGVDEMVRAVREAPEISPTTCRARVAQRYSADAMIDGYEDVYRRTVKQERVETARRAPPEASAEMPAWLKRGFEDRGWR